MYRSVSILPILTATLKKNSTEFYSCSRIRHTFWRLNSFLEKVHTINNTHIIDAVLSLGHLGRPYTYWIKYNALQLNALSDGAWCDRINIWLNWTRAHYIKRDEKRHTSSKGVFLCLAKVASISSSEIIQWNNWICACTLPFLVLSCVIAPDHVWVCYVPAAESCFSILPFTSSRILGCSQMHVSDLPMITLQ